jgi:hypothetical protein
MDNLNSTNPRPRPIDLLFGETDDTISDHSLASAEEGTPDLQHESRSGGLESPDVPVAAPPEVGPNSSAAVRTAIDPDVSGEYRNLASMIDSLYQQMPGQGSDSPMLRKFCFRLLTESGRVLESEEFAEAGFDTQQAKARLMRVHLREAGVETILDSIRHVGVAILRFLGRPTSSAERSRQVSW